MQEPSVKYEAIEAKREIQEPEECILAKIVFVELSETDYRSEASLTKDARLAFLQLLKDHGVDPDQIIDRKLPHEEKSPKKDRAVFVSLKYKGCIICAESVIQSMERGGLKPRLKDALDPDHPLYKMPPIIIRDPDFRVKVSPRKPLPRRSLLQRAADRLLHGHHP